MYRRILGAAAVVGLLTATPSYAEFERPRANCASRVTDDVGDGKYSFATAGTTAVANPQEPSKDDVDIEHVTVRHTGSAFEIHLKLKSLAGTFKQFEGAYRYDVTIESAERPILFQHVRVNSAHTTVSATRPEDAGAFPRATYKDSAGANRKLEKVEGSLDPAAGWLTWVVPAAEFAAAYPEGMTTGTEISKIKAETFVYLPGSGEARIRPADVATSADPLKSTYIVGNDPCFGPPPAALTVPTAAATAKYSDAASLTATLVSEAGTALAGKTVSFKVADQAPVTAVTNATGVATASWTATKAAGTYPVVVTFAGDTTDGKANATYNVTVGVEGTKLTALKSTRTSTTGRSVTTTLTDDDNTPLAASKIDWYANGKKVATTVTDAKGKTTYKGAKAGQSIVAKFAAVSGKYAAASTKALKV